MLISRLASAILRRLKYLFLGDFLLDLTTLSQYYKRGGADVVFYCRFPLHIQWINSTIENLDKSVQWVLVTGFPPELLPNYSPFQLSRLGLKFIRTKIAVSAATVPGGIFPKWIAPYRVHMPHSLVSFHMVYPPGSFDQYNVFFCSGEHHVEEVEALSLMDKGRKVRVERIGYGKIDYLISQAPRVQKKQGARVVLIAPSWGKGNILDTIGIQLVETLISRGLRVVLRPHPMFMEARSFFEFQERFSKEKGITIENPREKNEAIYYGDILISDYSGIAFEFAFMREHPVVFVDVPKKVNNPEWESIASKPVEIKLRNEIGIVVAPEVGKVAEAVSYLLEHISDYGKRINKARDNYLYYYGRCGREAAIKIHELLD